MTRSLRGDDDLLQLLIERVDYDGQAKEVAITFRADGVASLAHEERMLDRGEVASMAELARLGRVSRTRITQIMDLMLLAPEIQEEVLLGRIDVPLRDIMRIARCLPWQAQHEMRSTLVGTDRKKAACPHRLQAIRCNAAIVWPDAIPSTPARAVYYVTGERG